MSDDTAKGCGCLLAVGLAGMVVNALGINENSKAFGVGIIVVLVIGAVAYNYFKKYRKRAERVRELEEDDAVREVYRKRKAERERKQRESEGVYETDDEWLKANRMTYQGPVNKKVEAIYLLRQLHDLYRRGALSEAEFNMKKWELLSGKGTTV